MLAPTHPPRGHQLGSEKTLVGHVECRVTLAAAIQSGMASVTLRGAADLWATTEQSLLGPRQNSGNRLTSPTRGGGMSNINERSATTEPVREPPTLT
ncbi:MAG: hypothetical protein JWR11_608 [Mycobacterium sp.]|nr:hypothetical protein [Mycobacterium sp.]